MRFVPALIVAAVGLIGLLFAVASYQIWRKEGSLDAYAPAMVAGILSRTAVLLVAVVVVLATLGRTAPIAFVMFIGVLGLASTVIGVWHAIQTARSSGGRERTRPR